MHPVSAASKITPALVFAGLKSKNPFCLMMQSASYQRLHSLRALVTDYD